MSASTPIQTSLNNLSAWASFDTLLQRLDITTEPDFWDGLVTLIPYQDYFLESQYHDLEEGCVPGEAQQGPNKTQTPTPPNQPDPECLCANSPFYAWEIHGIECNEYRLLYWYHPDYGTSRATVARSKARLATVMRDLGHNEFITDMAGLPYQYFHYSAFGETLVEDNAHYGQFSSPYRFNAKELDQETGNYYYGARYYNPKWSIWLSVDPLAHKYPSMSPFVFSGNNPIMLVDPDGTEIIPADEEAAEVIIDGTERVLQERNIFYHDKTNNRIKYNDFNRRDYNDTELEFIDKYVAMIDDLDNDVHVQVVDDNEAIQMLDGKSLAETKKAGFTKKFTTSDAQTGKIIRTDTYVFISRNPTREGEPDSYVTPTIKPEPICYPSLVGNHEIVGHAYYKIFRPNMDYDYHNEEVEKLEDRIRDNFYHSGSTVRGSSVKHERRNP